MAKLIVSDDDPQLLDLVTLVLEDAGHTVIATGDSDSVHSLASQPDIDAIILDVNMPKSGFEVMGELRADPATSALPILFLSGLGGQEYRARGLVEGADDYMVKPFEPAELVLRVERLLAWRTHAEPRAQTATTGEDGKLRFGRYEALDVLGQGSMGTVYRGLDPRLERQVALKTIRFDALSTEDQRQEMLERLRNEAITIARFSHPNIIMVYDMGGAERSAFIAMELVEGLSLRDLLRSRGPLEADQLIPLAAAMASGLARAHEREVIHRDVKPGNVLLGREGAIKMSDFGLAFVVSTLSDDRIEVSGTPGYVPPEVLNSMPYSAPGDVFGLGATLYESLTGVHPFTGTTLRETIANTLSGNVRPLGEYLPEVPRELEGLVVPMLSNDPAQRPTASWLAEQLEQLATERQLQWSADILPER
ncbi:MAG: protein kinase [bacterium]|nr:protein kinase [bacterium]